MNSQEIIKISDSYKNNLFLPKNRHQKQFFFCPVGLVGAGKTTISKPIADILGLVRISSDEVRKLLKESGQDYTHLKEILNKVTIEIVSNGYSVAFDMDCGNPETKELIEREAGKRNIEIFWVKVSAPEEFIFEKFRKHPPSWLASNPEVMIENYLSQKKLRESQNVAINFDYEFDTSREDLSKQIEKCVILIKEKIYE